MICEAEIRSLLDYAKGLGIASLSTKAEWEAHQSTLQGFEDRIFTDESGIGELVDGIDPNLLGD